VSEVTYLKALAGEVVRSEDARIRALLAWCHDIELKLNSCSGNGDNQKIQAAATVSEIILEVNRIEEMRDNTFPHYHPTELNKADQYVPQFFYRPDFEGRTITVDVAIIDPITQLKVNKAEWKFSPITVNMRQEIR
jgi:hypothetical protein